MAAGRSAARGGEGPVAGRADFDSVTVQLLGHGVRRDRPAGDHAGEQKTRSLVVGLAEQRPRLGLFGQASEKVGQARRQQHRSLSGQEVGLLLAVLEVAGCQVAETPAG